MAKNRFNPLSGIFRDPPKSEDNPDQIGMGVVQPSGLTEQTDQSTAPTTPLEVMDVDKATDAPAPEQTGQGDTSAEPNEAPNPVYPPETESYIKGDAPAQNGEEICGPQRFYPAYDQARSDRDHHNPKSVRYPRPE